MCLYVADKDGKIETATESITVWKILFAGNRSPFQDYPYMADQHLIQDKPLQVKPLGPDEVIGWLYSEFLDVTHRVTEGFHAYQTKKDAFSHLNARVSICLSLDSNGYPVMDSTKVVKMTIPAGAHYVLGMDHDVVSDTIDTGALQPEVE